MTETIEFSAEEYLGAQADRADQIFYETTDARAKLVVLEAMLPHIIESGKSQALAEQALATDGPTEEVITSSLFLNGMIVTEPQSGAEIHVVGAGVNLSRACIAAQRVLERIHQKELTA